MLIENTFHSFLSLIINFSISPKVTGELLPSLNIGFNLDCSLKLYAEFEPPNSYKLQQMCSIKLLFFFVYVPELV